MGYRSAGKAFQHGLDMGQRDKEFEEVQGLREKEETRRTTRHKWEKEDREKKKKFEAMVKEIDAADAMAEFDPRGAAKKVGDLYNDRYPDNGMAKIIFREDNPEAEIWKDKNLKGNIVVLSQKGGLKSFNNVKELTKYAAGSLNYKEYIKSSNAVTAKVAKANTASKPFKAHDGKMYRRQYKEGPGGSVVEAGDPVPYTGKTAMAGGLAKASEAGLDTSKLSKQDKKILGGIREKEKQPTPTKPGDKVKAAKAQSELFIKDLSVVLKPFSKPGRTIINMESGEITDEGQNALDSALNLYQKYKDKKELTPQEKKKLKSARDVWNIYKKMQETISARYLRQPKGGKTKSWQDYSKKRVTIRDKKKMKVKGTRE